MGAIAGVFGAVAPGEVEAMLERLAHRGCGRGTLPLGDLGALGAIGAVEESGPIELGDRVLAWDAEGPTARELRSVGRGDRPEALEAVEGGFALAWLERAGRRLVLARDFFGSRPLHYLQRADGSLAFASEYKALLCLADVAAEVDLDMLQHLQHAKKLPLDRTLLAGIRCVPPGGSLEFELGGRQPQSRRFAPLEVRVDPLTEEQAAERIREGLRAAVRRQCGDGERLGIALSGGIDSIAVACLVRELHPERPLHTFTASNGPDDPEGLTGRRVSAALGATHHEVHTPPELLDERLFRLVWHLEDPGARSETLQLFELGAVAGSHVDVLLSGQGADSLFGGMPRYRMLALMRPLLRLPALRRPLAEFYNRTQLGLRPRSALGRALDLAYYRGGYPEVPTVRGASAPPPAVELPEPGPELVNRAMARGFQGGQASDFPKYERCFAAFGLVYRSPFCDLGFARSAYTVSDAWKIHRGRQKYILRRAMDGVVPAAFLEVPKFMQALRHDAVFADRLEALCSEWIPRDALERRGWFDPDEIEALRRRPGGGPYSRDAANRLWTVLLSEVWGRVFLDGRGAPPAGREPVR